jgi:uncharacterized protein YabE (DUF348 family)
VAVIAVGTLLALYSPVDLRGEEGHAASPAPVVVQADGEIFAIDVEVETVGDALEAASVELAQDDSVAINGHFVEEEAGFSAGGSEPPRVVLEVRRAVPIRLVEDGRARDVQSSRYTVGQALEVLGIEPGPADIVVPGLDEALYAGQQVNVKYARKLKVQLPGDDLELMTHAKTVEDALVTAEVPMPEEYRLEPAGTVPVTDELEVAVIAVGEGTTIEQTDIAAGAVRTPDDSLPPGEEVTVEGSDGVLHQEYRLTYENGVEVSRELVNEWYDPEPVDHVTYYSTQPTPTPVPPTPTPAPRPSSGGGGGGGGSSANVERWREVVCSYDWDCDWAMRVIRCESNGNPDAYNPAGPYIGLFQIHESYGGNLYDPYYNIAAAYDIWSARGTGPWPNC